MKRIYAIASTLSLYISMAFGQATPGKIVFANETNDTTRITELLIKATSTGSPRTTPQAYLAMISEDFAGTPYKTGTLEGDEEMLRINLDGMDCTTFVENMIALALTAGEGRTSWRDFTFNLERLRYRGGTMNGYASRLHYISDWALDNSTLGLLKEVTDRVGVTNRMVKSLDWITSHRNDYPALSDEATFTAMKDVENGFHGHLMQYIKSSNVGGAQLTDGDIVALVSKKEGLDVSHIGIVKMIKGKAHLVHASSAAGKVVVEQKPLADYLRRRQDVAGIRVFRLVAN